MVLLDEIKDFEKRLNSLYLHLAIEEKQNFIQIEELKTQHSDFWNDSKAAELIIKNIKQQSKWVQLYKEVQSKIEDLMTLYDFFLEDEISED